MEGGGMAYFKVLSIHSTKRLKKTMKNLKKQAEI
jgi:hypothetical protein